MKRIAIATLLGLCAGGICAGFAFSAGILPFTLVNLMWVLLNRAVMGFSIGISGLNLRWGWNGLLIGLVVGSIFSYFLFMTPGHGALPIANFFVNGIFGLLIECVTTVVFKQPAFALRRTGSARI